MDQEPCARKGCFAHDGSPCVAGEVDPNRCTNFGARTTGGPETQAVAEEEINRIRRRQAEEDAFAADREEEPACGFAERCGRLAFDAFIHSRGCPDWFKASLPLPARLGSWASLPTGIKDAFMNAGLAGASVGTEEAKEEADRWAARFSEADRQRNDLEATIGAVRLERDEAVEMLELVKSRNETLTLNNAAAHKAITALTTKVRQLGSDLAESQVYRECTETPENTLPGVLLDRSPRAPGLPRTMTWTWRPGVRVFAVPSRFPQRFRAALSFTDHADQARLDRATLSAAAQVAQSRRFQTILSAGLIMVAGLGIFLNGLVA